MTDGAPGGTGPSRMQRRAGALITRGSKFNGRTSRVHCSTPSGLTLCPCPASIAEPALVAFILFCFVILRFHESAAATSRQTPTSVPSPPRRPARPTLAHVPGVPGCPGLDPNIPAGGTGMRPVPPSCLWHPLRRGLPPCAPRVPDRVSRGSCDRRCTSAGEYVLPYLLLYSRRLDES